MAVLFSNNASSNLSASITSTATSLSVTFGTGAEFPNPGGSDYFYATLSDAAGNIEIIKVTARSSDTLTIVRGQDGTIARAWANSDKIELRLTAGGLSDLKNDTLALVNNGQLTVSAGSGLTGSGTFLANQSSNTSITISHADTSSQASVSNTGATVVQSVTVDGYGHVTAMASKTMGYADVGAPSTTGTNASGTWGISITGSAGSVAWTNVSGRPTAVSSFTNDSGYVTSSSLPNLGLFSTNGGQDFLGRGKRCIVATTSDMILNYGNDFSQVSVQSALTASGNISGNSDERLKTDWQPVRPDFIECLALVRSGTFTRIDIGGRQAGSAAQDWQGLLPEVVSEGSDEAKTLSLAYGNAALVSAIELAKRVVSQDAKIARLEALIEKLIGE